MAKHDLLSEEFLNGLDDDSDSEESNIPLWLVDDKDHTTYKSYYAILELQAEISKEIKAFGKVATTKTPKFYQMKKSNVARKVGVTAQSIFVASSFSPHILLLFNDLNNELLALHQAEQEKQKKRKMTGIRREKKKEVVSRYQKAERELKDLKCINTQEVIDIVIQKMPMDLRDKLGW
ncbi:hypothetical protein ACEV76_17575 [Vibrio parahaemolyticus]|uniref:hypothetical protein n=2 Tax=Vibrio TaxID=662 RepID=UPI000A37C664|nr:hypothetical protein [Vibrio parahaemolyticus]OUJ63503.1 hypothetical protein BTO03_00070 [Vibrio parahaemolyticus]TOA42466.1 hypothetical protein CGK28_00070 [Vibrio parahaemolyticus]HCH6177421.1 hypothetical protein [Vibrio parahaemolyticus]